MKLHPYKHISALRKLSIVTTLSIVASSLSHAVTVVSNLLELDFSIWPIHSTQYVGMKFIVGTDFSTWTLDSVDIRATNSGANTDFIVELHADNAGVPAVAALGTFSGANPIITGDYNFIPNTSLTLTAGTTYWLTAASTTNQYQWINTNITAETTALPGWSIGNNIAVSDNNGASWIAFALSPAKFAINATGVPEPSSLLLLGIGVLVIIRRKRS
jgi:hypothetical protein